ncbi:glycoside hydrolase family 99-like domain-containing protein [Flavobacterium sp. NG2]|uniref:glycosyltransferase WbsX family protein n=1 Tax=Flavobacterium sp. NG2 TaxID=3097547 RepID=UPI002A80B274|nr:glycoside hydrolase family 99-like domain-containing protein [Flavobacterium sp. NG2]WPR71613.1 glycoside hydrolase family 99-like domain-containing protein [Flavobacterium sp. NG2]
MNKIKPIAIYLPQFHPIAENDAWWGKGFTEWTNVAKAKPRFEGHYQPHLPADLGFYDLRLDEARMAQEQMAKDYGIHGFCYYHYWFNGKRVLHEPLDRKLKNSNEDFPFMMCWANENWTRTWDGGENNILLKQVYSEEDDLKHILHLIPYFKDDRYIKIDGKPVFVIYRANLFPDIKRTIQIWNEIAINNGLAGLHIGYVEAFEDKEDKKYLGFDFGIEFQPNFSNVPKKPIKKEKLLSKYYKKFLKNIKVKSSKRVNEHDRVFEYEDFMVLQKKARYKDDVSPMITPMWDNSPRRKRDAFILKNASPELYGNWLEHLRNNYDWDKNKEKFLFINAWNEWAEGNHLEPCHKWGTSYLEITKKVLSQ